uniref:Succinate:cytochrome c oxidoreductase subunit 3 n=1 Tax=Entransia fimbriata TaxID=130991 RepID=U5YGU7_9VIRI|nr:succinate:cytochrome c oxidoreductase subunit 3 [Entransia fimbriata]AGZ90311.1 succinate:cytochrome c oxidoreductase subunit 3 [Entransia fimbriata]
MKTNRPLSPHLTIYRPQFTSVLSIFHRISGFLLASWVTGLIIFFVFLKLHLSVFLVYWTLFQMAGIPQTGSLLVALLFCLILALSYHMSNGIRHLFWDLGFYLDLEKVYRTGIIVCVLAILLAFSFLYRIYF